MQFVSPANFNKFNQIQGGGNGAAYYWESSPGQPLPPGFSLTRSGTNATYFDSAGLLQTAGANVARGTYRYNGSAWVFDGTMIEQAATNICLRSEAFDNGVWATEGGYFNPVVVTPNTTVAPDGNTTADTLTSSTVPAGCRQIIAEAANTTYTFSVWVKTGTLAASNIFLIVDTTLAGVHVATIGFSNLTTATAAWQRFSITVTTPAAGFDSLAVGLDFSGAGTTFVWGAQLEVGSAPTSYIATGAASATRNADIVTAPTSGLQVGAQGFAAGAFRLIAEAVTGQGTFLSTDTGGGVAGAQSYWFGGAMYMYDTTGGAFGVAATPTVGAVNKVAVSWGAGTNGWQNSLNGVVASGNIAFDGNMNFAGTMRIGASTTGTLPISMVLQSLRLGVQTVNNSRLANPFA